MKVDFKALYRDHYRRVFGLCARLLGNAAQAEDAVQEVFVRAYRGLDRYDAGQPFAAWVLRIAGNHCIDLVRRRVRDGKLFDAREMTDDEPAAQQPSVLEALLDAERAAEIRAAIDALPDKYRLPIVLAYYNESSYEDIAHVLGIERNHVGVLLLRAKRALRDTLATEART